MEKTEELYKKRLEEISKESDFATFWDDNEYYHKASKTVLYIINILTILIFLLSCGLYYFVSSPKTSDSFFVVNDTSSPRRIQGLYRPNNSTDAIAEWVSSAVVDILTFGFNDYNQRFGITKENFTQKGWESFRKALLTTGFLDSVIDSKQIITAAPRSEPVLLKDGIINGEYTWVYEMELLITFRSGGEQSNNVRRARVFVQRLPTSESPRGIGISDWMMF